MKNKISIEWELSKEGMMLRVRKEIKHSHPAEVIGILEQVKIEAYKEFDKSHTQSEAFTSEQK